MKWLAIIVLVALFSAGSAVAGNVEIYDVEMQTGKMVKGGQLVSANVVTSFRPLTNKILKDLAETTLVELKKKFPSCYWFHVVISDDRRMLEAGNHLVIADYKEGKSEITGGILSGSEIKEYRKEGIPVMKPDEIGIKVYAEVNRTKIEYGKQGRYMTDPDLYKIVSNKMKLPVSSIKKYHKGVGWYYSAKMMSAL